MLVRIKYNDSMNNFKTTPSHFCAIHEIVINWQSRAVFTWTMDASAVICSPTNMAAFSL
jgi:hypothetical protein